MASAGSGVAASPSREIEVKISRAMMERLAPALAWLRPSIGKRDCGGTNYNTPASISLGVGASVVRSAKAKCLEV